MGNTVILLIDNRETIIENVKRTFLEVNINIHCFQQQMKTRHGYCWMVLIN